MRCCYIKQELNRIASSLSFFICLIPWTIYSFEGAVGGEPLGAVLGGGGRGDEVEREEEEREDDGGHHDAAVVGLQNPISVALVVRVVELER